MSSDVTNIDDLLASFDELWAPRIVARVNDWAVKIAKVRGEHVWHAHADTDEVFVVLSGELEIARRDPGGEPGGEALVRLGPRDVHVVPRGVQHRPRSAGGAVVMLVEPASTLSTGDFAGAIPDHITATSGLAG
ncbi:cupin domain-containing protein [Pseudonocardia parietis]|uniref:Mannose-6-phosphate isomerase-like protein (Cupin superfamily) n=1 Tax=Pseudonocardia parietis TaxID=570936 RepID=A0ABS4VYE7_9PSEU|nr:cupin domain-containing protein [Pseudonocardia parietis]MBP2368946.1 mannose-6-phosphate isomerase-like protein (cupin superfamily) [Pseudonocardia parietis]